MRKKRMDTIFISDDGVKDDTFIKVAGEYAEGVYATGPMDVSSNPMAMKPPMRPTRKPTVLIRALFT
jgi:branched-chain amino acid transport system substrate-binding protein